MTSILKLVCSEVSALNENSILSLVFFFFFFFTQSPCKILHFVSPFTSFIMVSFLGQKSGIAHFKDNQVDQRKKSIQ